VDNNAGKKIDTHPNALKVRDSKGTKSSEKLHQSSPPPKSDKEKEKETTKKEGELLMRVKAISPHKEKDKSLLSFTKGTIIWVTQVNTEEASYYGYVDGKDKVKGWFPDFYVVKEDA